MIKWPWKHHTTPDPAAVRALEESTFREAAAKGRRKVAEPVIGELQRRYAHNHFSEGWLAALGHRTDGTQ